MAVVTLKDFEFIHLLEYEETSVRSIAKKKVIGRVLPTPQAETYVTMPRVIVLRARINKTEKESLRSIYNEAAWQQLVDDGTLIDWVWIEEPNFRWDTSLGCGERQFLATITLICSRT